MKSTESEWRGHDRQWYLERIAYMSGFMLPERLAKLEGVLGQRTRWMTICMENAFHPHNASALIRNCEAFGVQDIHTIEDVCTFRPNTNIVKGTDKWVDLRRHAGAAEAMAALKSEGYRIVATTPHHDDTTPDTFDVGRGPFALVFGTEHAGISDEVISAADEFIKIPMYGFVESLNVSASAAILLQGLSARLRAGGADWRLTEEERLPILLHWIMSSVRDSRRILARGFPDR